MVRLGLVSILIVLVVFVVIGPGVDAVEPQRPGHPVLSHTDHETQQRVHFVGSALVVQVVKHVQALCGTDRALLKEDMVDVTYEDDCTDRRSRRARLECRCVVDRRRAEEGAVTDGARGVAAALRHA